MMATKPFSVSPLLDVQTTAFAKQYDRGISWSLYRRGQGHGPFFASLLQTTLERYREHSPLATHDPGFGPQIGFLLGRYHGGVLSPQTGLLRPEVRALIAFDSPEVARGYRIGREAFFHEVDPLHYRYSEQTLIEQLLESIEQAPYWKEPEATWHYVLGCLFGELSGSLFPETREEAEAWQDECQMWEARQQQRVVIPVM